MSEDFDFDPLAEEDPFEQLPTQGGDPPSGDAWWGGEVVPLAEDPAFTNLDYGPSVLLVDSDYSGAWNHAMVDVDGDGQTNVIVSVQGEGLLVMIDAAGDGHFEDSQFLTFEELAQIEPELAELLAPQLELVAPADAAYQPVEVDYAATTAESPFWFEQAANGLCVPASVAQVVAEYTGVPFESEAAFVELANEYGLFWVGPDGVPSMSAEGALFLLEQAGVPASLVISANLDMLEGYLDAGHGVVLPVSSSEIWFGETGGGVADHALVITDIDRDAGIAILSDPGHPEGDGFVVPLDTLEQAWAAGGNTMIVAEEPAEGALGAASGTDPNEASPQRTEVLDQERAASVGLQLPGTNGVDERLHSTVSDTVSWAVQQPWVLLTAAIGISKLKAR